MFITGSKPAEFKSKRVMTAVRKKAMDNFLKGGNGLSGSTGKSSSPLSPTRAHGGPDNGERPLSIDEHEKFLALLQNRWHLKLDFPRNPEALDFYFYSRRLVHSQIEEAMALFEAIVSTCPDEMRTGLLSSILKHVYDGYPLERWWATAGTGDDNDLIEHIKGAFDNVVKLLEGKWHLEHDGSRVEEANKVYELMKETFYVSREKLSEAIAFFETIAGGCEEDRRAELLHSILQQVKKGVSLEQWWTSMDDVGDRVVASQGSGSETVNKKNPRIPSNTADADDGSLIFITGTRPSEFKSKKNMTMVRKKAMSSFLSNDGRGVSHYTPNRTALSTALPPERHNRDSGDFSERDASMSRFATPQTMPSLTERSTISPRRMLSPWTPVEIEGPQRGTATALAASHMEAIEETDDLVEFDPLELDSLSQRPEENRWGNTFSDVLKKADGSAISRRKVQNMLAQQAFFARKKKLEDIKKEEELSLEEGKVAPRPETDTANVTLNKEVLMYQLPGEEVIIQCVCGNMNDGRFIIPCIKCGRWQHIRCYYELAQDVVEDHECVQCDPRDLNGQGKVQAKRPAEEDPALDTASTATQSAKRPKTMDADSSIAPSIKPLHPIHRDHLLLESKSNYQNILDGTSSVLGLSYPSTIATSLASKSNYQNLLEGTIVPGVSYPTSLSTNLTSKRGSHKIAEQGRRNRINVALEEMKTLLPSKGKTSSQTTVDITNSKASTVESAIEYIKELQLQLREKDWLLEEKDRQFEQLWSMGSLDQDNQKRADVVQINSISFPETIDSGIGEGGVLLDTEHETSRAPFHVNFNENVAAELGLDIKREEQETRSLEDLPEDLPEAHTLVDSQVDLQTDRTKIHAKLPESWKWDVEYQPSYWTCTPLELDEPKHYPLTIAGAPVVLPVEHQWPPIGGVNPPPDPRPSAPIDCTVSLSIEVVRDLFLTFEKSIGFYLLVNGLLQVIVSDDFDTAWASSHLPHKYGGLKVCYIPQTMEATMLPSTTETTKTRPTLNPQNTGLSSIFRQSRQSTAPSNPSLRLNDFIEARPKANHRKEKYAGRIGLKVLKAGEPYLIMSTHVITEAILAKSHRETFFGRGRGRFDKLDDDWNEHVDVWAANEKIGSIDKSFDKEAEVYPNGFHHDITLVKPTTPSSVKDIVSPMKNLGWLSRDSWSALRQQTSAVKILGPTEDHRSAKSIKCSRPSEILVVGEGIFLNQTATAGNSKSLKDHDISTWRELVSRALLYRVYPDFDPPNGHSGVALYADGMRDDGSHGPGIVGFQSFVQRSGHVQNFNMEGPALERRLQLGRIAFYGAFEVPEELKREYTIA